MSTRHKEAHRGSTGPPSLKASTLARRTVVHHRARVTNPSQDVRRQVKAARSRRGWTQRDLAKAAKVSRGSIQNLETGMKLDETTESKIEEALGKPTGWLDQLRAGHESEVPPTSPPPQVDPSSATLADLQAEYVHFMQVLTPTDMERLYRLVEMYHQLQLRVASSTQGGDQAHA